jgi:centromeric protein E
MRMKLENERSALQSFVTKFDALGLGGLGLVQPSVPSRLQPPKPTPGGAAKAFAERQYARGGRIGLGLGGIKESDANESPIKIDMTGQGAALADGPSLLHEDPRWELSIGGDGEDSFEVEQALLFPCNGKLKAEMRDILGAKENLPV